MDILDLLANYLRSRGYLVNQPSSPPFTLLAVSDRRWIIGWIELMAGGILELTPYTYPRESTQFDIQDPKFNPKDVARLFRKYARAWADYRLGRARPPEGLRRRTKNGF